MKISGFRTQLTNIFSESEKKGLDLKALTRTFNKLINQHQYPISKLKRSLWFPADNCVGGASWTLDPSMEAVNCEIKLANKFI